MLTLIHSYKNESDLNVKAQRRSKSGDLKQRNWLNAKNLALFMVLKTNTLSI